MKLLLLGRCSGRKSCRKAKIIFVFLIITTTLTPVTPARVTSHVWAEPPVAAAQWLQNRPDALSGISQDKQTQSSRPVRLPDWRLLVSQGVRGVETAFLLRAASLALAASRGASPPHPLTARTGKTRRHLKQKPSEPSQRAGSDPSGDVVTETSGTVRLGDS